MKYSEDALLQAAATIVAAQITAKAFNADVVDEEVIASALEAALRGVANGRERWEREEARKLAEAPFPDARARQDKPRRA